VPLLFYETTKERKDSWQLAVGGWQKKKRRKITVSMGNTLMKRGTMTDRE
jgi:hypothetical protein